MNLLEAAIALIIAAGVIAAALEASPISAGRTALARLETEATIRAEALLAGAGAGRPLAPGRTEGGDGDSVRWVVDIQRDEFGRGPPDAYQVSADVRISRDGRSVRQKLVTLKLAGAY